MIELTAARSATVGSTQVRRALPTHNRRTVGAWCFADHMGPATVNPTTTIDVGPHPHTGLHTVTWLTAGELVHRDSLGSEQLIRPGQLNLMTAGHGVVHAEQSPPGFHGTLEGIQLWVAQPEATRHGPPAFAHHADLGHVDLDGGTATVLIGDVHGTTSPASCDPGLVGAELRLHAATTMGLRTTFEHAVVVLDGAVDIDGTTITPGHLGWLAPGRDEVRITPTTPSSPTPSIVMVLGGEPFTERLSMWWNFVARTRDEIDAAREAWNSGDPRFGPVDTDLAPIAAPQPPWQ